MNLQQLTTQRTIFACCAARTGYDYLLAKRKGTHCEADFERAVTMISLVDALKNFNPDTIQDNKDNGFITNEQAESIIEKLEKLCTYNCDELVPFETIGIETMEIEPSSGCCPDSGFPAFEIE